MVFLKIHFRPCLKFFQQCRLSRCQRWATHLLLKLAFYKMNVLSEGRGDWGYKTVLAIVRRAFPGVVITHDSTKEPHLIVRSHFLDNKGLGYNAPYILWSGESYRVKPRKHYAPLFELNSFDCDAENSIYYPLLAQDCKSTREPQVATEKKYCCAYANSVSIRERQLLFSSMLRLNTSCYGFGPAKYTKNNPFVASSASREKNATQFSDFAFVIAMENKVQAGYITEKIGYAFETGAVPIYDSRNGVDRFFNTTAFFDVSQYPTPTAAGEAAVHIWNDKQKLQKYLDAPIRTNGELQKYENLDDMDSSPMWMIPALNALSNAISL